MKKLFTVLIIILCLTFIFTGCYDTDKNDCSTPSNSADKLPENNAEEINTMYIYIYGNKLKVSLVSNSSVSALIDILKTNDIIYTADDYGDFEKVGNIGYSLPRNDSQITTQAGDVILYQGNSLCLYYGQNTWSFTRIGKIDGYSKSQLRSLLGAKQGKVSVRISLS